MSAKRFPVMNAAGAVGPAVIEVYEEIGKDWWTDTGIGAAEFAESLKEIPPDQEIVVAINSPGGNVWDGLAIYHQLQARKQRVTCRVDGVAASIASVIACAGKETEMPENALLMIHNPWCMAVGDSEELRKSADVLDKHREVIAGIYFDKTGMDPDRIYQLMDAETWMTGKEACAHGFCKTTPAMLLAAPASTHINRFRNAPKLEPATGTRTPTQDIHMPDNTPAPAPVATPAPAPAINVTVDNSALAASLDKLIAKMDSPAPGAPPAPVAIGLHNLGSAALNKFNEMQAGRERSRFARANMSDIVLARASTDEAKARSAQLQRDFGFSPQASNTISSSLVNDFLADGVVVAVHNKLALLNSILADFGPTPMKPLVPVDVIKATAAATTLTNATDFETGDGTLDVVNIAPNQYSQPYQMRNDDLQKGFRLEHLALINANAFADKIHDATTTLCTAANFGSTSIVVGAATTWGASTASLISALAPVKAAAKNYDRSVLWADGGHLAYLLPTSTQSLNVEAPGAFGFDNIYMNNRWTGASTNTVGFISNGKAIAAVSGVPMDIAPAMFQSMSTVQLKNGMNVTVRTWYSTKTRTIWACLDIIYGAAVLDSTAGRILVSAAG